MKISAKTIMSIGVINSLILSFFIIMYIASRSYVGVTFGIPIEIYILSLLIITICYWLNNYISIRIFIGLSFILSFSYAYELITHMIYLRSEEGSHLTVDVAHLVKMSVPLYIVVSFFGAGAAGLALIRGERL